MADQNKTNKVLLLVVVGVLVALNALFITNYLNTKEEKKQVELKLESTDNAKKELEKQYSDVLAQLEDFKGKNEKLNTLVDQQKVELDAKVAQIRAVLQSGKITKADLEKAREEIKQLNKMLDRMNQRVDSLNTVNSALKDENQGLSTNLKEEKDKVENLTVENTNQKNKIAIASVLKSENLKAASYNIKDNGKEKESNKASSANRVKVTFNLSENFVAEKNQKVVCMKIITPGGSTIPSPDKGTFTFQGSETSYTQKINFQFTNTKQQLQLVWDKGTTTMEKGNYKVELYCEGFIIGSTSFTLK